MEVYIKVIAGALIAVVLALTLSRQGKDISVLLSVLVSCMIICAGVIYLRPILSFLERLRDLGQLDSDLMVIMLKAVGIALLAEITALVCADANNAVLGKSIQIVATVVILWLSLPLFTEVIDLVEGILGSI